MAKNSEQIITKKLSEIIPYVNNPRHNEKAIDLVAASIAEFGFKNPIILDEKNVIIAGHTRYAAAKKLGMEEVPCIMAADLTPSQVKAFRLADNKVAEAAEWDMDLLNIELDGITDIDMSDFGFNLDALEEVENDQEEIKEDEPPEPPTEAKSVPGDIYQLGEHRLMCGDSTSTTDIDKLMNGEKADLVFTDPPYGMKKEKEGIANDNLNYDDLLEFNRQWIPLTFGALKDNGSWYCWGTDEPLMDIYSNILKPMAKENKITFRNLITWDKGNGQGQLSEEFRMYPIADEKCLFVMTGVQGADGVLDASDVLGAYLRYMTSELEKSGLTENDLNRLCGYKSIAQHWTLNRDGTQKQPRLIQEKDYIKIQEHCRSKNINAFKREYDDIKREYDDIKREYDDIKREWYSTRAYFDNTHDNMNNVWHFDRTGKDEREHTGGHATPKPLALCARAIKSSSRRGEIVLDVFGGSGSTLIACEQLGRRCYMMELEPKYVDVIIERWEKLTGKKAQKIEG